MWQGVYCGEQPYKVIALCALAIAACCLGLLRFQVETDPQRLWVGCGSLAAREKAQYEVTPAAPIICRCVYLFTAGQCLDQTSTSERSLVRKAVYNKLALPCL